MIQPWVFIVALIAGGFGALSRYGMSDLVNNHIHTSMKLGTFIVNISACFLEGLLGGLVIHFVALWTE